MSRVTPLYPIFGGVWSIYWVALLAYFYGFEHSFLLDAIFFGYFAIAESIALAIKKIVEWEGRSVALRDTLSEFMTFVSRMAHPSAKWWQSWNALVVFGALHLSAMVSRNIPPMDFGLPLTLDQAGFGLMVGFLVWHWLRPDKTG